MFKFLCKTVALLRSGQMLDFREQNSQPAVFEFLTVILTRYSAELICISVGA
jgi:hypothetical protein